jgi:hypothetical protein
MGQFQENFAALAEGASGAPKVQTAAVTANTIRRDPLATSASNGSTIGNTYTLAGGTYSWWTAATNGVTATFGQYDVDAGTLGFASASATTKIIYERYIQSSPPYDLGDGGIPLFMFLLIDSSGVVTGTQVATDPPWANNGPTNIAPERYAQDGRGYRRFKRCGGFDGPWLHDAWRDPTWRLRLLHDDVELFDDWCEITQEIKNRDQEIVPHPFGTLPPGWRVLLLDVFAGDFGGVMRARYDDDPSEVGRMLRTGGVVFDNRRTIMRAPAAVMPVRARLR